MFYRLFEASLVETIQAVRSEMERRYAGNGVGDGAVDPKFN
jgi:hypothetical protein